MSEHLSAGLLLITLCVCVRSVLRVSHAADVPHFKTNALLPEEDNGMDAACVFFLVSVVSVSVNKCLLEGVSSYGDHYLTASKGKHI